jgi:hypothetical protein
MRYMIPPPWFRFVFLIVAMLSLIVPMPAHAQERATLTVSIHDETGAPLPNVRVIAVDAVQFVPLAASATDAAGVALLPDLPPGALRVQVTGRTASGRPLIQPGLDAQGIAVRLAPSGDVLHLRTQPDGLVLPDPATMIAPDAGGVAQEAGAAPFPTIVPAAPVDGRPAPAALDGAAPGAAPLALDETAADAPFLAPDPGPTAAQVVGRWILAGSAVAATILGLITLRRQTHSR